MRPITLILPYYLNAGMLLEQQRQWAILPADIRQHLHVIVVDDGSPRSPARAFLEAPTVASVRLYRVLVDVRWNWLFCRNLGVHEATTKWVFLTDIDHVVPADTWRALMAGPLDPCVVYRFSRVDAPHLTPYKPHPNTWLLTRRMYDRIGGYDERFSGYYGTDFDFRDRAKAHASIIIMRSDVIIRYPREVIADASTTTYGRKEPQDKPNVYRILDERNADPRSRPLRLTFPWERVL